MWCLVYLERESPNALVSLLKEKTFEVHIAPDSDDLLDALWYHGSAVGCVVAETHAGKDLQELLDALKDWPDLDVLIFSPIDHSIGKGSKIHLEKIYTLQNVARWLSRSLPGALDGGSVLR